jgi:uncharacterized protein YecT (DUF1311 family)
MKRIWLSAAALLTLASPAAALDCKRASTKTEHAICADPAATAADAAMGKAYETLRLSLRPPQRAGLLASQVQWLQNRDACIASDSAATLSCILDQTEQRRAFLSGAAEAGPGPTGRIAPYFRYEAQSKGRAELAFDLLRFVNPASAGEKTFNAMVDKLASDVEQPDPSDLNADNFYFGWKMRLVYASPKFISAHAEGSENSGGAHPNSGANDFNIDMTSGTAMSFDQLLDKPGADKVFALCVDQVVQQKKAGGADALDADDLKKLRADLATSTSDLKSWSFAAAAATVSYDPYEVGSYAEGAFTCKLPYTTLRPLAKPTFPLP